MTDHDPFCPMADPARRSAICNCTWIEGARADERERIVAAIEAMYPADPTDDVAWVWRDAAARIARSGGGDE